MKTILLALVASTTLALPAFAQEGNGDPFPLRTRGTTTFAVAQAPDVGSAAFPNLEGRPGSALNLFAGGQVPDAGSEQSVQTANSLPQGFTQGLPVYARLQPSENAQATLLASRR